MLNVNLSFARLKVAAVVDVAPGGAGVAIVTNPHDAASTILASAYSALSLEPRTPEQQAALIGEQIKEASAQALKIYASSGHKTPISDVYVIVHAPWSRTIMLESAEKYDAEVRIHAARIEEMAKSALDKAREIDQTRILEASVIKVSLNGYPTPNPDGKYAHLLSVVSLASDCDAVVRSSVEAAVQQSFPVARHMWRSGLRTLMSVARESLQSEHFLIVDMGATDTHMVAISESGMLQLVLQEGTATILRRIAAQRSADEVIGFLRMLSRDACSTEACDSLRSAIATAEPELVRVFGEAMAKIAAHTRVPNDLLLMTHPDLESWLSTFLARIDFAQFTVTSMPLSVNTALSLDLSRFVAGAHNADTLTIGAALVNIENRA